MGDSVRYKISVTPLEEITDENAGTHTVIAGEVGTRLGGGGIAVVSDYSGTGADQGYKDAAPYYFECLDDLAVNISNEVNASFVFIKNTGHLFSSTSVLGATLPSAEHVVITIVNEGNAVVASLAPGEAQTFKALQSTKSLDCTEINVQTFESDGSAAGASDHIAVEFLVVD